MLVDWFTVGAQALNFAVLVWLLKRFLYQPVLNAIDQREQHVAAALADADAKQASALQLRDDYQKREEQFDRERDGLLAKATEAAEAERQRLLAEARQAADALSSQRQQALQADARRLNQALLQRTQQQVLAISRQALADLADTPLEAAMVAEFVRRLQALDGAAKASLAQALGSDAAAALVRSALDLPQAQRDQVQAALDAAFGVGITLRFETAPDLVAGIELSANGQKLAWSIADYLEAVQRGVDALLPKPSAPSAPAAAPDGADADADDSASASADDSADDSAGVGSAADAGAPASPDTVTPPAADTTPPTRDAAAPAAP